MDTVYTSFRSVKIFHNDFFIFILLWFLQKKIEIQTLFKFKKVQEITKTSNQRHQIVQEMPTWRLSPPPSRGFCHEKSPFYLFMEVEPVKC
jgi:hypothetical protein